MHPRARVFATELLLMFVGLTRAAFGWGDRGAAGR
jgi:hypothetical protein